MEEWAKLSSTEHLHLVFFLLLPQASIKISFIIINVWEWKWQHAVILLFTTPDINILTTISKSPGIVKSENWKVKWSQVKSLSLVWLFVIPWTVAYQAPPSMGFSRQEYWSRLPFPWVSYYFLVSGCFTFILFSHCFSFYV